MKPLQDPAPVPRRSRRLPARYAAVVMPLLLSIFMTCIVSLISTLHSVGMADGLLQTWLAAWALS